MTIALFDRIATLDALHAESLFETSMPRAQRSAWLASAIESLSSIEDLESLLKTTYPEIGHTASDVAEVLFVGCSLVGGEYNFRYALEKGWEVLLEVIVNDPRFTVYDLTTLLCGAKVESISFGTLKQFSIENAISIVCRSCKMTRQDVSGQWSNRCCDLVNIHGPGNVPLPSIFEALVESRRVKGISKSDRIVYADQLSSVFYMDPPWVAFDFLPGSMAWRMGPGEDYMDRWRPFFSELQQARKSRYLDLSNTPDKWREWILKVF